MTDKTVVVRLRAEIAQYQANLTKAAGSTRELGRELTGAGKTGRADLDQIARGSTAVGVAAFAGFAIAANATMGFDKQLSELSAVSSATASEMDRLRDAALEAGAKTAFSAQEAAVAQTELAKAGVSTADILGGALTGALDLAAAGGIDLGKAAEIAATSMTTFGLAGRDVSHIADVLAAGANKSAASVDDIAMALSQSGLVADQFGLDLEDTVGVLAMFSQRGLSGSDAGTSFKTMLQRLVPTSKEAADKMAELGIEVFDAQGKFIGIDGAAQELRDGLAGLTEEQRNTALATIFGSDAVRAATILYEGGAAEVNKWTSSVDDAGFAGEVAGERMDNLAGDLEELRGSIETALIQGGSQATGALRFMAQGATDAVNGFAQMPAPLQGTFMGLTAVAGAGGLALGAIAYLGPRARELNDALNKMGPAGEAVSRNLSNIGKAAGVFSLATAGITIWVAGIEQAKAHAKEWSSTWEEMAHNDTAISSMENYRTTLSEVNFQWANMSDEATKARNKWGSGIFDAKNVAQLKLGADELEGLGARMRNNITIAERLATQFHLSGDAALEFVLAQRGEAPEAFARGADAATTALEENYLATTTGTVGSRELDGALGTLEGGIASVEDETQAFTDALDTLYDTMFAAQDAQDELQRGLNDLPGILKTAREEGLSLNDVLTGQSNAAIDVRDHMEGVTRNALDTISAWKEQGIEGEELQARIDFLSGSFRKQAEDAGLPAPVVDHYLGILGLIPTTKNTKVTADTSTAWTNLDRLARKINSLPSNVRISVGGGGGIPLGAESGGYISSSRRTRPGPSDTIPMLVAPGEYVMKASAVDRYGVAMFDALNGGSALGTTAGFSPTVPAQQLVAAGGVTTLIVNIGGVSVVSPSLRPQDLMYTVRDAVHLGIRRGVRYEL